MKNILIPTDFSANSKNAIRYALNLFEPAPSHFFLLYVNVEGADFMNKPIYNFGTNILMEKAPRTIDEKLRDLERFVQSISSKRKHHRFTSIREDGPFLKSIRRHIKEDEIELIVMGTKGASELKEFIMGTRSGDVITKVESDVLVIPDKVRFKKLKEVVFAVDFEMTYDDAILKKIANFISSKNTHLQLVYVTKSQMPLFEIVELRQKELVRRLSKLMPNPIGLHRMVSKKVEEGVRIFAERTNADLIIMISKDYGLLQRLFLDTTVEEVSFETRIPLLSLQG